MKEHADNQSVGQIGPHNKSGQEQIKGSVQMPAAPRRLLAGDNQNPEETELRYA